MISTKSIAALFILGVLSLAGCREATIENVSERSYGLSATSAPKPLTLEEYEKAIVRAGIRRGWSFERVDTGHLLATNTVRGKHTAVVDVKFTAENYSITFNRSQNLRHDASKNTIHPNYNHWVRNLGKDIRQEVMALRAS